MSKKLLAGIAMGALVFIPTGVVAAQYIELPWTNNIYRVSDSDNADTISVFDDGDNKCYVATAQTAYYDAPLAISCVKN